MKSLSLFPYLILVTLSFTTAHFLRHALVDDSFIYLRVAENLLAGHGWVYNLGERVNPCTSLVHPPLLALGISAGLGAENALIIIYGLGLALLSAGIFLLLKNLSSRLAFLLVLLVLFEPALLHSIGMESSFFLALVVFATYFFSRQWFVLAGLSVALAILCRLDALALLLILTLAAIREFKSNKVWLLPVTSISLVAIVALVHLYYFQVLVPHSITIKYFQSSLGWFATQPHWLKAWFTQRVGYGIFAPFAIPYLLLAWRSSSLLERTLWYMIIFGIIQAATYSVTNAPSSYFWYFCPANFAMNLAQFLGMFYVLQRLCTQRWSCELNFNYLLSQRGVVLSMNLIIGFLCLYGLALIASRPVYLNSRSYRAAADYITQHASKSDQIACAEIGYLGYITRLAILDMHGLIHPAALEDIRAGNSAWWIKKNPAWIVVHDPTWYGEPNKDGWSYEDWTNFKMQYKEVFRAEKVVVLKKAEIT